MVPLGLAGPLGSPRTMLALPTVARLPAGGRALAPCPSCACVGPGPWLPLSGCSLPAGNRDPGLALLPRPTGLTRSGDRGLLWLPRDALPPVPSCVAKRYSNSQGRVSRTLSCYYGLPCVRAALYSQKWAQVPRALPPLWRISLAAALPPRWHKQLGVRTPRPQETWPTSFFEPWLPT